MGRLLENLTEFTRLLRSLGLAVPAGSSVQAARAALRIDIGNRDDFRFALRSVLVQRAEDLRLFDQAFRAFWSRPSGTGTRLDLRPLGSDRRFGEPIVEMESLAMDSGSGQPSPDSRVERVRIATYSERDILREKDFKHLTAEELEQAVRLLRELRWRPAPRRTRRWVPGAGPALDLRTHLRAFARAGETEAGLPRRIRKQAPRRLVLLCDISGSMERYTRMLLWFACCLAGHLDRVEAFLFATRLTRVTRKLQAPKSGNPLREIARLVPDWSGGTRIGAALRTFNVHWARRVLAQGAVVLLVSDGWDRGEPEELRREIARLQRSCHRLIWLNPLLGAPGYEPLTRGLQAALPHIDSFLPAHNLASLERLATVLNDLDGKAAPGGAARGRGEPRR